MPEVRGDRCEIVSSEHNMTVAMVTSQRLWLFAPELHKFKPDDMQVSMREGPLRLRYS